MIVNKTAVQRSEKLMRMYPQLAWFTSGHLPPHLAMVSEAFAEMAWWAASHLPDTPLERAQVGVCLDRLLEAKDAAVRAKVGRPDQPTSEEQVRGD